MLTLTYEMYRPPRFCQAVERMLVVLHRILREVCGSLYVPREVHIQHSALSPLETYRRVFGVTPRFSSPKTGILVTRSALDLHQPGRSA